MILLDGGETSGEDRLPFLEQGIVRILAEAASGVGVIFEHRYYGESYLTKVSLSFSLCLYPILPKSFVSRAIGF